jgi:hypothetical protein
MSLYRIYNQGEIARFAGAFPWPPGPRFLRGPRINSGRGLALGHRSGVRPQMDHPPRLDDAQDGAPAA